MSKPPLIPKYRPVLSSSQITHIISLAKADASQASLDVVKALAMYEFKIQNDVVTPAYTETVKQSLEEQLGFVVSSPESSHDPVISTNPIITELHNTLYETWLKNPSSLSVTQLAQVQKWRYENDMMTLDEERKYETETFGLDLGNGLTQHS